MGAPSSSIFSEIYIQYIEHKTIYGILLKYIILGYFCYVDDILRICDTSQTDITDVRNSFHAATYPLQFTIKNEQNNQINFLDVTIRKENNLIKSDIYRKQTGTDIIILQESCHPIEPKLSEIIYLQDRHNTYITDSHSKQQEQRLINHILHNSHYDPATLHKLRNGKQKTDPNIQRKNRQNSPIQEKKPVTLQNCLRRLTSGLPLPQEVIYDTFYRIATTA
jgi:hypothetical protein